MINQPEILRHYQSLHEECNTILGQTIQTDLYKCHSAAHQFIEDFSKCILSISERSESALLKTALKEYASGLLCLAQGHYRCAFFSLRFFLEQSLRAVYLSGHEVYLQHWLINTRDISWSTITHESDGIFSTNFIRAFFQTIEEEGKHYNKITCAVYRETSELVHGNCSKNTDFPERLCFDIELFSKWHEKCKVVRLLTMLAFTIRYIKNIATNKRIGLEHQILEYVGFLEPIRSIYSSAGD